MNSYIGTAAIILALTLPVTASSHNMNDSDRRLWSTEESEYRWGNFSAEWVPVLADVYTKFSATGAKISCFDVKITGHIDTTISGKRHSDVAAIDFNLKKKYFETDNVGGWESTRNPSSDNCGRSWSFIVNSEGAILRDAPQR